MSKPKLLLADDSITIQKVVNLTFADQGMDVVAFSDGDAAIENFDTVKPDIVLADVHMPGINGYQLCELLRSDAASSKIPVVLLVGSFEPFDREEAQRVGASAYLTKPFTSIAELVSTVENLLTEPAPVEPALAAPEVEPEAEPEADPELEPNTADLGKPDTSDIDSLYEQSFVETVEIPNEEREELEFDEIALDDEMIQTSYVGPEPDNELEDIICTEDITSGEHDAEIGPGPVHEAEDLIAQSIPEEVHFTDEVAEAEPVHLHEQVTEPASEQTPEPEEPQETGWVSADTEEEPAPGPFDSVAADLPPIEEPTPISSVDVGPDEFDLLELPVPPRPGAFGNAPQGIATDASGQITSLSPELIDLIVEKVVARLEEKQAAAGGE